MQDEKKLKVYNEAISLAKDIYLIEYEKHELYGLQSQIRRAALSISLNIAEGSGTETQADFARYLVQARASCKEVQCALDLSKELGYIDLVTYNKTYEQANILGSMLTNLIKQVGGKNEKK